MCRYRYIDVYKHEFSHTQCECAVLDLQKCAKCTALTFPEQLQLF